MAQDILLEYAKLSVENEIGILTIHNGRKNLIIDPVLVKSEVLDEWINENQLKALIITGEGRHFSYGADVDFMKAQKEYDMFAQLLDNGKKLLAHIEQLPIITVAAINGACFGAGFEIALSCQIRICSKNAFLGLPEVNRGLIPGLCGVERLTQLIGKAKTIELCLQGEMLTAEQAFNLNIVSKVVDSTNCLDVAKQFVESLINERNRSQIASILRSIRECENVSEFPEENSFVKVLKSL